MVPVVERSKRLAGSDVPPLEPNRPAPPPHIRRALPGRSNRAAPL